MADQTHSAPPLAAVSTDDAAPVRQRAWPVWVSPAIAVLAAAACMVLVRQLLDVDHQDRQRPAGETLGLFLGGLAAATLLVPGLSLIEPTWRRRLAVAGGAWVGIAIVCLTAVLSRDVEVLREPGHPAVDGLVLFTEWLAAMAVILAYALALAGLAAALRRTGLAAVGSAALTVAIASAWLTWPIWMAPWLKGASGQRIVAVLVPAHPLFAINGALWERYSVPWAQHRLAYQLTNIGDDIPYTMPKNILPAVATHAGCGCILMFLAVIKPRRRPAIRPPTSQAQIPGQNP